MSSGVVQARHITSMGARTSVSTVIFIFDQLRLQGSAIFFPLCTRRFKRKPSSRPLVPAGSSVIKRDDAILIRSVRFFCCRKRQAGASTWRQADMLRCKSAGSDAKDRAAAGGALGTIALASQRARVTRRIDILRARACA